MIKEFREIGRVNDAPILLIVLELAKREWVALAYKNNVKGYSFFSWSTRDQERVSINGLVHQITERVAMLSDASIANEASDALFDVRYEQPAGWDRWLGGVPNPIRKFFDEVLQPRLKAALDD